MNNNIMENNINATLNSEDKHIEDSVLIVDDNNINRLMLRSLLEKDYTVYEAENGLQALDFLSDMNNKVSVILLDILMPVMDGYEFLKSKRKNPDIFDIPVIVMTGKEAREDEIKALEIGADDFIGKPYDPTIVKLRIANIINSRMLSVKKNTLEYFMNNITAGICVCAFYDKSHVSFVSDGIFQSSGYQPHEFIEKFGNDISLYIHPDDRKITHTRIMESVSKRADIDVLAQVLGSDNKPRWNHFSGRFAYTENDRSLYFIVISDVTEHRETEIRLIEQSMVNRQQETELLMMYDQLQKVLAHTSIEVWQYDIDQHTISIRFSDVEKSWLDDEVNDNISVADAVHKANFIMEEDKTSFVNLFEQIDNGYSPVETEIRLFRNGSFRWNKLTLKTVNNLQNEPVSAIGICRDVNNEVEIRKMYDKEMKYRMSQTEGSVLSAECNLENGQLIDIGNSFTMSGLNNSDNTLDISIDLLKRCVHPEDFVNVIDFFDSDNLINEFEKGRKEVSFECRMKSPQKKYEGYRWMNVSFSFMKDPVTGLPHLFICIRDINKRKQSEFEYREKAQQDSLTGLVNRATFEELVTRSLKNREEGSVSIFIILDLDNFKAINDSFGHAFGDEVLVCSAMRLKSLFRSHDIVARLGGDEFAVFMTSVPDTKTAKKKGKEICEALEGTRNEDLDADFSCSVGIAMSPIHGDTFETLYKNADAALYKSKKGGKNRYAVYGEE